MNQDVRPGATYLEDGRCHFCVWAPLAESVAVHIVSSRERMIPLKRGKRGYYHGTVTGVEPGDLYFYILDGKKERPDPASRYQPQGVHGPSQIVAPRSFTWSDHYWTCPALKDMIFYELHVGTFTPEGTFDSVIPLLVELKELGINAIELMPVAQFPGSRNWGYDGVYPFAVQNSYGGPEGLRRLVNACHLHGLAVFLDVVYNHLGPEGNYLADFGPYFTDRYRTPWGQAINFDGPGSDEVRLFFIKNALYWIEEFHVDGLRLDAVHAITDKSAVPFLEELAASVHRLGERLSRRVYAIAESDLNDPRLIRPQVLGGYGLDAQWNDDFHHALHSLLTGEQTGYYRDFGSLRQLACAFREGYIYTGQHSTYRGRRHGRPAQMCRAHQFVVFSQNHDQVGNRAHGERLSALVSFSELKLAASTVIFSPFLPLLFMGEEYGETAPFLYFTSHSDPSLIEAVRRGRREEFAAFNWTEEVPDPQDEATYLRSKLNNGLRQQGHHRVLLDFYRTLIKLRREIPALAESDKENMEVEVYMKDILLVRRWNRDSEVYVIFFFGGTETTAPVPLPEGRWRKRLDASEMQWLGEGSSVPDELLSEGEVLLTLGPRTCILFERTREDQ